MNLEAAALRYASNGWAVFPLYGIIDGRCECGTNCGSPGKHPRVSGGLHDATTEEMRINAWWKRWPNANIGVRTGLESGLYVIDLDNKRSVDLGNGILVSEGENSLKGQESVIGRLPETLTQITGSGGSHLIFRYPMDPSTPTIPENTFGNRAGILPSVDTRGDGGYIVVPPSLHPSGNRYRWVEEDQPIASIPRSWISWLQEAQNKPSKHSLDLDIPSDFQVQAGEGRHDWLFRMGSKLRGQHGLPEMALYGALQSYNLSVLRPPLQQREVEHIVESVTKFEPSIQFDRMATEGEIPPLLEAEDLAISLIDFINEEPQEFKPLVSRLLNSGEAMIIGGPPNVGKTWAVMDMMLGISSGTEFALHYHCSPGTVLFIDEEGSKRGDWERFHMLLAGREVSSAADFPIFTKIDSGIRLDSERGVAALSRLIERYRPAAVFMDSLVRVHGGEESNNRAMAEFFRITKRLMITYETAFVFTHHIRKPGKDVADDPSHMLRGASDIQGFPDSILILLPTDDSTEARVVHSKMRNGPKESIFTLGYQLLPNEGLARVAYRHPEQGSSVVIRDDIQRWLVANPHRRVTAEQIAGELGVSLGTVKDHLKVLEAINAVRLTRESNNSYYQAILV